FGKLLPNVGFTYKVSSPLSVFGSFAKGFSSPRTDNLYRAPIVDVDPEETNAYDLGVRYTTARIQAQAAAWKIDYSNRIVSSFNQDLGISLDRNVGKVKSWGMDGNVAFRPTPSITLLALASYIKAELQDNVELNTTSSATPQTGLIFCDAAPTPANPVVATCAPTAGKMVSETPKWQVGGRANFEFGPVNVGVQAKRVGARFATDVNDVKLKGYTVVDLDARFSLADLGLGKTYFQANLQNLFDTFYYGNISTQIRASDNPNFAVGGPRTLSGTLNVGF
ncbi:MAG TPA: TonB-dependent receptor, partial [Sphingomicrobium sp.]|nr:TonB-dependent receptor [Sphingomicrobium sp.]